MALVCELCGSIDFAKQEGFFVCQKCGMKYSLEEARNLIGKTSAEPAKPESSPGEDMKNIVVLAERAKKEGNTADAEKYYTRILEADPDNWNAYFNVRMARAKITTVGNIGNSAVTFANSLENVFELIDKDPDKEVRKACALYVVVDVELLAAIYKQNIKKAVDNRSDEASKLQYQTENCRAVSLMRIVLGDALIAHNHDQSLAIREYRAVFEDPERYLQPKEVFSLSYKLSTIDPDYMKAWHEKEAQKKKEQQEEEAQKREKLERSIAQNKLDRSLFKAKAIAWLGLLCDFIPILLIGLFLWALISEGEVQQFNWVQLLEASVSSAAAVFFSILSLRKQKKALSDGAQSKLLSVPSIITIITATVCMILVLIGLFYQ